MCQRLRPWPNAAAMVAVLAVALLLVLPTPAGAHRALHRRSRYVREQDRHLPHQISWPHSHAHMAAAARLAAAAPTNHHSMPSQEAPVPVRARRDEGCQLIGCNFFTANNGTNITCYAAYMQLEVIEEDSRCASLLNTLKVDGAAFHIEMPADSCGINLAAIPVIARYAKTLTVFSRGSCCTSKFNASLAFPRLTSLRLNCTLSYARLNAGLLTAMPLLNSLDASSAGLSALGVADLAGLTQLAHLNLSYNTLTQLETGTFDRMTGLTTLDLAANAIITLPSNVFAALTNLVTLNLADNYVTELQAGLFVNTINLTSLDLTNNHLGTMSADALGPLTSLVELVLDQNNLGHLERDVFEGLVNLEVLILDDNDLTGINATNFINLTSLMVLSFSVNDIAYVEAGAFDTLPNLEQLAMEDNLLTVLPKDLFHYNPQLQYLSLFDSYIAELDEGIFHGLTLLNTIILAGNNLDGLPEDIFQPCTMLEVAALSYNSIDELEPGLFSGLSSILYVDVESNDIATIDAGLLSDLSYLVTLRLGEMQLASLPNDVFAHLSALQSLDLGNNRLHSVESSMMSHMRQLVSLDLSGNELKELPSSLFASLTRLESLELQGNKIEKKRALDLDLSRFPHLQTIMVQGVPLSATMLKQLRTGTLSGLLRVTVGGQWLCADSENTVLSFELTNGAAQLVSISDSLCTNITVVVDAPELTLRVYGHSKLEELRIEKAERINFLDVSDNPLLVKLDPITCESADVSRSGLAFSSTFCSVVGKRRFIAQEMKSPAFGSDTEYLMQLCFPNLEVVDLSGNDFMNDLDMLNGSIGQPFVVDYGSAVALVENSKQVKLANPPHVPSMSLGGLPVRCTIVVKSQLVVIMPDGDSERLAVVYRYNCECIPGYHKHGDACVQTIAFLEHGWAIVLLVVVGVVVGVGGVVVVRRYLSRYRSVQADLELKEHLLAHAEAEVDELKKAWEIGAEELAFHDRLDKDSPGANSEVWRAGWDHMTVAVKILRSAMLRDHISLQDFSKEVEFLQRTRHPNLVRFFGAGTMPDGSPFLVLEMVELGSLVSILHSHARLSSGPAFDLETKIAILTDIARGMSFIHALGHLHRDLKSGNVLVTAHPHRAKVADYGTVVFSSAALNAPEKGLDEAPGSLTLTAGVGTPLYSAPELLRGGSYGQPIDVYSFGCIIFELLFETSPDLLDLYEIPPRGPFYTQLLKVVQEGYVLPFEGSRRPPLLHERLDGWIVRLAKACLRTEPEARPTFETVFRVLNNHGATAALGITEAGVTTEEEEQSAADDYFELRMDGETTDTAL